MSRAFFFTLMLMLAATASAQKKKTVLPIHTTFKGTLVVPIPTGNKLFRDVTETIGQVDGSIQFPVYKGLSLGAGAKHSWFGIEDRALAPIVSPGEVRRLAFYGKVAYEHYTGPRTFYEFWAKPGIAKYTFKCTTCPSDDNYVFHWGAGASFYLHASDNLAFCLMLGYETDAYTFGVRDFGIESLPGRRETMDKHRFQNILFGMGFSTTFKKSQEGPSW